MEITIKISVPDGTVVSTSENGEQVQLEMSNGESIVLVDAPVSGNPPNIQEVPAPPSLDNEVIATNTIEDALVPPPPVVSAEEIAASSATVNEALVVPTSGNVHSLNGDDLAPPPLPTI